VLVVGGRFERGVRGRDAVLADHGGSGRQVMLDLPDVAAQNEQCGARSGARGVDRRVSVSALGSRVSKMT